MNAARLLEVLRDARDEGRWQEQAEVLRQLDIDCKHVRFVMRNLPIKPRMVTARDYGPDPDDYDNDYDPDATYPVPDEDDLAEQNRERRVRAALEWKRTDWLAWRRRTAVTSSLATVADVYRRIYTDARVSERLSEFPRAFAIARPNHQE